MLINGNALRIPLADNSVHCVVTSPPYYGLRDYETSDQIGLERTPEEYVSHLVSVFCEVWRVLRPDGTAWLIIGDSYFGSLKGSGGTGELSAKQNSNVGANFAVTGKRLKVSAHEYLKPKDLMMIPAHTAIALQREGWYLRSDIIWNKTNPMPGSYEDRPTSSHEYVFFLTKKRRYYYDKYAIEEPQAKSTGPRLLRGISDNHKNIDGAPGQGPQTMSQARPNRRDTFKRETKDVLVPGHADMQHRENRKDTEGDGFRNKRDVWTMPTANYSGSHFATFPPDLVEPCILAGTSAKGCCPECGTGWKRVIERNTKKISDSKRYAGNGDRNDSEDGRNETSLRTTGWEPTCKCGREDVVPAIVLDPFVGSGTTVEVARYLGRRGVGLDLSLKYLQENALPRAMHTNTQEAMETLPLFAYLKEGK